MNRFFLSLSLFVIIFAPTSFAANRVSTNATGASQARADFESQQLHIIFQEAQAAHSEELFDQKIYELAQNIAQADRSLSPQEALDEIIERVDGEQWVDTGWHTFDIIDSVLRSQGMAIDEKGAVWYSGEWDVLRAKSLYGADADLRILPIPAPLQKLGDNHVGDIDTAKGKLYLPIEDGPKYLNPHIGVYDPQNLKFESAFTLPTDLQPDGVPWVAVDSQKGVLYSSSFDHPSSINVYDINTGKPLAPIQMSQTAPHAQGAKVYGGMMYITSDGSTKGIIKLNLTTGTAMTVGTLPAEVTELEGLAISHAIDGMALNVMAIGYGKQSHKAWNKRSEIHVFKMVTTSMRNQLRQSIGTL